MARQATGPSTMAGYGLPATDDVPKSPSSASREPRCGQPRSQFLGPGLRFPIEAEREVAAWRGHEFPSPWFGGQRGILARSEGAVEQRDAADEVGARSEDGWRRPRS